MENIIKKKNLTEFLRLLPQIPQQGAKDIAYFSVGVKSKSAVEKTVLNILVKELGYTEEDALTFFNRYYLIDNDDPYGINLVMVYHPVG